MNTAPLSWRSFGPAFARAWSAFFETPADLRTIWFVRTMFAMIVLINLAFWAPDLELLFGEGGVLPGQTAWDLQRVWTPSVFKYLPATNAVLYTCFGILTLQTVLLLLGVYPRFQAVGVFIGLVSFHLRNVILWDSEDDVMRLVCLWLIFMPIHRVGRRDLLLRSIPSPVPGDDAPNATAPAWGLRMLQFQLCLIFFDTFCSKIQGEPWQNGTAIYYAMRLDEFSRSWIVPEFLISTPWIVKLMTWSVLLIEGLAPFLIWFKETRRPMLLCACAFHFGCMLMMHLFLFHPIMLCGWAAFLTTEDWNDLGRGWLRLKAFVLPSRSRETSPSARSPHEEATAEEELIATKMRVIDPDRPACFLPW